MGDVGSTLLAVPNVSEGSDVALVGRIGAGFGGLRLLDTHLDPDHDRSVFTLAGVQGTVASGLVAGVAGAIAAIDIRGHAGIHPHVGAVDVCPVVYLRAADRGAACAEALVVANALADHHGLPVFLYGELSGGRERAEIRRGGPEALLARMAGGEIAPDFGPGRPHPTAGATLVAARPPLVAFNLELAGASLDRAAAIASGLRESGGGPAGVRALGLWLATKGVAQVSCNVHDPLAVPLAELVGRVRREAEITSAELVGLAPRAAFDGFPDDLPIPGFDPRRHLIESVLGDGSVVEPDAYTGAGVLDGVAVGPE